MIYAISLRAGLAACPKCGRQSDTWARVLSRDAFGMPMIEQRRIVHCLMGHRETVPLEPNGLELEQSNG